MGPLWKDVKIFPKVDHFRIDFPMIQSINFRIKNSQLYILTKVENTESKTHILSPFLRNDIFSLSWAIFDSMWRNHSNGGNLRRPGPQECQRHVEFVKCWQTSNFWDWKFARDQPVDILEWKLNGHKNHVLAISVQQTTADLSQHWTDVSWPHDIVGNVGNCQK